MVQWSEGSWKNTLGEMMKNISRSAGFSRVYANHCVRVTVVTELKEQGFSNDEIASVTGHKSSDSVSVYHRRRRDLEKKKLSDALNQGFTSTKRICNGDDSVAKEINFHTSEKNLYSRTTQ